MSNPHDPRHDLATFTVGPVTAPEATARRRLLTSTELSLIAGPSTIPLNDPILPERVIKALLSIAGTAGPLLGHEAEVARLCWFHTRNGDGS